MRDSQIARNGCNQNAPAPLASAAPFSPATVEAAADLIVLGCTTGRRVVRLPLSNRQRVTVSATFSTAVGLLFCQPINFPAVALFHILGSHQAVQLWQFATMLSSYLLAVVLLVLLLLLSVTAPGSIHASCAAIPAPCDIHVHNKEQLLQRQAQRQLAGQCRPPLGRGRRAPVHCQNLCLHAVRHF